MRLSIIHRLTALLLIWIAVFAFLSCSEEKSDTPSDAYKRLFGAVKAKNSSEIKKMLSKDTIKLGESAAARGKKSFEDVIKNGFTSTTFAEKVPAMRDERIKDKYGAVEVFNSSKGSWEDVPFIMEDGTWKLAVGNIFAGNYVRPGKSRSTIEQENANAMGNSDLVPYGNGNVNTDVSNVKPINKNPAPAGNVR